MAKPSINSERSPVRPRVSIAARYLVLGLVLTAVPIVLVLVGVLPDFGVLVAALGPAAVAFLLAGLAAMASRSTGERRNRMLANATLGMAVVGPALFYWGLPLGPVGVAANYPTSGGPLELTWLFWILPLGVAAWFTSIAVAIVGLRQRWPFGQLVAALLAAALALIPVINFFLTVLRQFRELR